MKCPDCGAEMYQRNSRYGRFWGCDRYPECKGTFSGMGTPGNAETRAARIRAHAAFDPLWRTGKLRRKVAYQHLRLAMQMPANKCHISMFDAVQCARVIQIVARWIQDAPWLGQETTPC